MLMLLLVDTGDEYFGYIVIAPKTKDDLWSFAEKLGLCSKKFKVSASTRKVILIGFLLS